MPGPFNISVDPLQDYRSASRRIRNGRPNQLLAEGTNLYRHSGLRRLTQSCYRRAQSATVVKMFARDVSIGLRAPLDVEVDRPLCFRPAYSPGIASRAGRNSHTFFRSGTARGAAY